ncbi:hypothetical protein N7478_008556 [Penicillium angulare]|uniref:uncharacterized protein n=1 Tax=Penicillium angulare TaxID=116970 RepID=UPI0025418FF8|nr:uncharacterized protein N7478_008556 [Penicillium angulare]KAJ5273431.1 hypothetical protein N7478_008556 [Penicillium angulare]
MDPAHKDDIHSEDYVLRHRKDALSAPIRKRIVICCDGTWQSAVSGKKNVPSNVTRLCRSLNHIGTDEKGEQWQQIVFYDSGVGTNGSAVEDVVEGAFGQGVEQNVIEAYNFCVLNYRPGDKIMCFGFSRGAYTARTIAGLISDIGICQKWDLNQFPDLWAVYKKVKHGKRFDRSDLWFDWMWGKADEHQGSGTENDRTFRYTHAPEGDWAQEGSREVEVVGVFDTVGSIGMPEVLGFKLPSTGKDGWHNVGLSPNIRHAFQALALDEHRQCFSPSVYYLPNKTATPEEVESRQQEESQAAKEYERVLQEAKDLKAGGDATDAEVNAAARKVNQVARAWNKATRRKIKFENRLSLHSELKQVWFPGYHVNIGGGDSETLEDEGDMEEMSNITYSWMLDQIKSYLSIDERFIIGSLKAREKRLHKLNEEYSKWEASVKTAKAESLKDWVCNTAKSAVSAVVHRPKPADPDGPAFRGIRKYGWGEGILINSFTSMYWLNGKKWRTPGEYGTKDGKYAGETFEFIHPVVNYRVERMKELNKTNSKHALYRPLGPSGEYKRWKEQDDQGNTVYKYLMGKSTKPVTEWKLGGMDSYERLAVAGYPAYSYVDILDDEMKTGFRTERLEGESFEKMEFGLKPTIVSKSRVSDASTASDGEEGWGTQSQSTVFDANVQPGDLHPVTNLPKSHDLKSATVQALSQEIPHQQSLSNVH